MTTGGMHDNDLPRGKPQLLFWLELNLVALGRDNIRPIEAETDRKERGRRRQRGYR